MSFHNLLTHLLLTSFCALMLTCHASLLCYLSSYLLSFFSTVVPLHKANTAHSHNMYQTQLSYLCYNFPLRIDLAQYIFISLNYILVMFFKNLFPFCIGLNDLFFLYFIKVAYPNLFYMLS
jgi:hypothetical protein